jgi:hypothetical protein
VSGRAAPGSSRSASARGARRVGDRFESGPKHREARGVHAGAAQLAGRDDGRGEARRHRALVEQRAVGVEHQDLRADDIEDGEPAIRVPARGDGRLHLSRSGAAAYDLASPRAVGSEQHELGEGEVGDGDDARGARGRVHRERELLAVARAAGAPRFDEARREAGALPCAGTPVGDELDARAGLVAAFAAAFRTRRRADRERDAERDGGCAPP